MVPAAPCRNMASRRGAFFYPRGALSTGAFARPLARRNGDVNGVVVASTPRFHLPDSLCEQLEHLRLNLGFGDGSPVRLEIGHNLADHARMAGFPEFGGNHAPGVGIGLFRRHSELVRYP